MMSSAARRWATGRWCRKRTTRAVASKRPASERQREHVLSADELRALWRALDLAIGCVMWFIAASLIWEAVHRA